MSDNQQEKATATVPVNFMASREMADEIDRLAAQADPTSPNKSMVCRVLIDEALKARRLDVR